MKHGIRMRKLNRTAEHRWALLRTMVTQLIFHERIETTVPKAKELRKVADQMITLGKAEGIKFLEMLQNFSHLPLLNSTRGLSFCTNKGTLLARRQAAAVVRGDLELHKLFQELAERYKDRAGGYTRVLRTRVRQNDAARMAYIEFVDRPNELRQARPPRPPPAERPPIAPWIKSRMSQHWAT